MDEEKQSTEVGNKPNSESTVADLINITIKTVDSQNFQFQVENNMKIRNLKEKISSTVNIESDQQRMIYCGRVLSDEKTLLDYGIDNNKVIHVVKRQIKTDNDNQVSSQNANRPSVRRTFRTFRNEDGPHFMSTISMEPPSLINHVIRHIFPPNFPSRRQNVLLRNEDSNSNSRIIRIRFNQIREMLSFVESNFQLLDNPNHLPPALLDRDAFGANHVITPADYIKCFTDTFNFIDRVRPFLFNWFQALRDNSINESTNIMTLLRIVHHISHILHGLTDLRVDRNRNPPISINVLSDSINVPNIFNPVRSNASSNSNTNANNVSERESRNNDTSNAEVNMQNESSNETREPTPIDQIPWPTFRVNTMDPEILWEQPPTFLMELDTTANVQRANRPVPNFSITELNSTISNLLNVSSVNFIPMSSTGSNTNNNNDNLQSNSTNEQASSAIRPQANIENATITHIPLLPPSLEIVFDPYLNCNSTYTVPEFRRANSPPMLTLNEIMINRCLSALTQVLHFRTNENVETEQNRQISEFFDFIHYIFNRLININADNIENIENIETGQLRINHYFQLLKLFEWRENNLLLNMLQFFAENFNFEQLYNLIQNNYHDFDRLRQPIREFIRVNVLHNQEPTAENIQNEIFSFTIENITSIVANVETVPGINVFQSFSNFIKKILVNFFTNISQSLDDGDFENTITNAFKRLALSFVQFCRFLFTDPENAINVLIKNFLTNHSEFINARLITFLTNIITDIINMCAANFEIDNLLNDEIKSCLVWETNFMEPNSAATVSQTPIEGDGPSNSCDSEDVEFADAISDEPSKDAHI